MSALAINGGPKAVTKDPGEIFVHPIIDQRDEKALLDMLHSRQMSSLEPSLALEAQYAKWQGTNYALAHNTGTAALYGAFYGLGVGEGDEVICPTVTYWASAAQSSSPTSSPTRSASTPRTSAARSPRAQKRSSPSTSPATRPTWTR